MAAAGFDTILAYHQATKHHFQRYARSAGYMDWDNQPNPFRNYEGTPKLPLPLSQPDPSIPYDALYSPAPKQGHSLTAGSLGSFLALCLGLSAWKAVGGNRWPLRINPSSGNLHPTEGYLILPPSPGLKGGVYHYRPLDHALEYRAGLPADHADQAESHFGSPGFLVALSTIFWRESWKYGERAYRYCCLDTGHALAALAFAARMHGWRLTCLDAAGDRQIQVLLGFERTPWQPSEEEHPELIGWVAVRRPAKPMPQTLPAGAQDAFAAVDFAGVPNRLSRRVLDWDIINRTAAAAEKPVTEAGSWIPEVLPDNSPVAVVSPASEIIRRRRSAVSYNRKGYISSEVFWSLLQRTLAVPGCAPFGAGSEPPGIHLLIFVHRVNGMLPGLYLLVRRSAHTGRLRAALRSTFQWEPFKAGRPLYLLEARDVTSDAATLSCHQEIAGHSAFAIAMLAPFDDVLKDAPYRYRHLYRECGMIGQVLYLGAEAHGIRGTGIGCFFDDPVHELLGIEDRSFQSLYHFTVGHPIEDRRLSTLPAYHHLDR